MCHPSASKAFRLCDVDTASMTGWGSRSTPADWMDLQARRQASLRGCDRSLGQIGPRTQKYRRAPSGAAMLSSRGPRSHWLC